MMPNTPALVQCGATVFARGANTLPVDGEIIQNIVSTFGICEEMPEKHMDAVTGLSGSGPAFVSCPSIRQIVLLYDKYEALIVW